MKEQSYGVSQEKIWFPSHNALLLMGYFVQVVMWGNSDETCLKCKIRMSIVNESMFHHLSPSIVTSCTEYPIGNNALWVVHHAFSCMSFSSSSSLVFCPGTLDSKKG